MARLSPLNIAGGAYSDDARPWSAQDTVNYLPVPAERAGTRSPSLLRSAPGFTVFATGMKNAPVRCLHNVEGLLLAVVGDTLYRIAPNGQATAIGTVPGVRRVTMAHNQIKHGHEVVIANGQSGYLYRTTDGTFQQITDPGFPGFKAVDFVDGYIAGIEPAGRFWLHSDLLDAGSYNTMDRYDAEASPDKMVAIVVSSREVMILSGRSAQFFRNVGGATGTFANSSGTEIEVGCASTHAVARLDNTVYWLGHDGVVYRLAGHQPQRVSTGPIEQAISRCNMANAFAFTFEDRGHKVFYLTFPDGHTWGYDVWSGEWHRRQSQGFDRWRLSTLVKWNGRWIGGDFANGQLYALDWDVQHEAGDELEKRRVTPSLHDNQNAVTVPALEVVVDNGLPAQPATLQLRYSRDGAHNWSDWRHLPMGEVGDFQQRVMARRLGRGIRWVFDIRVTDPVRADLLAASIQVEG
ncbi:packaged DNA stabilization protein gp10 [Lysobacter sp. GX 14042]|uniref:packaged DNA stabilization protein n=1 Tax=Lysobacter sp. GX 14042 TaxID=2907155 RepID=UPI001F2F78B4|nr:packaged DNA stabilization protein [Lysobacter sp. GX 14042]MCE7031737.1 packaged DNA stabilization protein gp10 [Lysobacter sp. GX 14042]